ncbi:MAG TPA: glycosyltransferase family 1 protein, partial [Pirellulales bacterium]|nr:glycosyltransferase family 1 protein [Pirellulales bacterium]
MKIGIDMLAVQSAGRLRGTGRYTRALVAELLADARHQWVLYYYATPEQHRVGWDKRVERAPAHHCGDGGPALASSFVPPYTPHTNVTEHTLPAHASFHKSVEELLGANADGLDLLLLTCPLENFQGYLPPFPRRGRPKLAALVYDLIPLRFPQQYLAHAGIAESYRRALAAVRQYDVLLTISEACRQDVLELLHVSPDRVLNVGTGSDAKVFYPPRGFSPQGDAAQWLADRKIRQPFIYAMTALDHRKNLSGLISALERLPASLIDQHQFVITCATSSAGDAERARAAIDRLDIAERVTFTGPLDDAGLRTLYQHCAAFVFPSRYEGFGLPLIEAMQCGAPVIGGRNSSQIEVVGEAGLLADVDDPNRLAEAIAKLLSDAPLAARCRERGPQQATQFTWQAAAGLCLDAFDTTAKRPRPSTLFKTLAARGRL